MLVSLDVRQRIFILVLLFVCAAVAEDAPTLNAFRPVEIRDTALVRFLGQSVFGSGPIPQGHYELAPPMGEPAELVFLRDGTEICRIDSALTRKLLERNPEMFRELESAPEPYHRRALQRMNPEFDWLSRDHWPELMAWDLGWQVDYGGFLARGEKWWIEEGWSVSYMRKYESFFLGASFRSADDYMNLQDTIAGYYGRSNFSSLDWSLTAGIGGIRYELQRWSHPLPEYSFLEDSTATLFMHALAADGAEEGKVLSYYSGGGPDGYSSNVVHRIHLKFHWIRYSIAIDGDAYRVPVHRFYVEDMPAGRGRWGTGVLFGGGRYAPGVWFELPRVQLHDFSSWNKPSRLGWFPFRLNMQYIDNNHFRLDVSTRIRLDPVVSEAL